MDWDYHTIKLGAQQGWQCPVCGAVNAPWVMQCPCGGKVKSYTTYTPTALSGVDKIYAYKNIISPTYTPNGKQITE